MPGPQDLIDSFGDDSFETAEEFKQHAQKEINREASRRLSPSQQERLNMSFDAGEGDGDAQLLMKQYDLLRTRDQYRFEQFASRDEVEVVSTNMEWTDGNENLIYFVMYHVPPSLYNRMRRPEVEDPTLHAIPPEEKPDSPSRGRFERMGYAIDRWIARVSTWFSSWF